MLKRYLIQRHIILDSGRTTLALEKEYWQVMERFAEDDGWSTWRDWFYMNVLPGKPDDIPLSSHVRKTITTFLFNELEERKGDCC